MIYKPIENSYLDCILYKRLEPRNNRHILILAVESLVSGFVLTSVEDFLFGEIPMNKNDLLRGKYATEEEFIYANLNYWVNRLNDLNKIKADKLKRTRISKAMRRYRDIEAMEKTKVLNFTDLNLGKRVNEILNNNNINSISSLVLLNESKLLRLKGLGLNSLKQIKSELNRLDPLLSLGLS